MLTEGDRLLEVPTERLWLGKFWCLAKEVAYVKWSLMEILSQGRSQEETTTEANTRSVVRNQPYEIF